MTAYTATPQRQYQRWGECTYAYDLTTEEPGEYLERTTDPKGNITDKTYDRMGRLSYVTVGEETTSYEYDTIERRYRVTYPDEKPMSMT